MKTERPFFTRASQRQCLREATRGRCVSGARGRGARVCQEKAGKTPLVPQTGQSNSAELVEKCPLTTRHKVRNAVTTAEVKSPKLQTCDEQQPRGDWSHEPRDLDGSAGPRCTIARTTCETSAWKPLETRPHNNVSGARGVAAPMPRTGQCRHGWTQTEKNSQGRDPRTQEKAKEHSQLQAKEHTQPQGKELKLLVIRHSAIDKIVEMPGVVECKVPTLQSSAETATVPQVQFLTRVVDVPVRNNNEDQ